jgi:ApaG protein
MTKSTKRVSKRPAKQLVPHHAYESVTQGMRIRVEPRYLDDQSAPENSHFVWSYTIEISNVGQETVQLKSRAWQITDELGRRRSARTRRCRANTGHPAG